uniref:Uncharacterized protein n=2 Tax=Physcomitrium patens TaxID=3218 RepID=A0A2K1K074_PHYPA|nr:hypothetical protein PHYPA_014295 [Physcomitrium patens]
MYVSVLLLLLLTMAAGIARYGSDALLSVEADNVLMREPSNDPVYREDSRELLHGNAFLNEEESPYFAAGYPNGGNYELTKDSRATANATVGNVTIETALVAERIAEVEGEDQPGGPPVLGNGFLSGDIVTTDFAGTNGVNEVDPLLDTLQSDTISAVPTPDLVKGVVGHLEQTGIIPEVIDRFTPTTTVRLIYNDNLEVLDGTKVSENDVSKQPKVEIEGAFVMPGSLYTIMLVSSSAIGEGKERVHWIHVNYQGPQDIGSAVIRAGADVLHCEAPKAGSNSNQLVFLLFRQPGQLVVPTAHSNDEISARSFAATHHLTPVGALCFMVA